MGKLLLFVLVRGKTDYLIAAKNMGYRIAVAEKGYENKHNLADYVLDVDHTNTDELIINIVAFNQSHKIDAVLTLNERAVEQTAYVAKVLGLKSLDLRAAKICRNKYLTRATLENSGLDSVQYKLIRNLSEVESAIKSMKLPIIIKPVNLSGSCAVARINNYKEVSDIINQLEIERDVESNSGLMQDTISTYWILEEYIDGYEISVQSITDNGVTEVIAIHDKVVPIEGPKFFEEFVLTPSPRISLDLEEKIRDMTIKALEVVGFDYGLSHLEFRITSDGPKILELNARIGGGLTNSTVFYSNGIDMFECYIKMLTGEEYSASPKSYKPVAVSIVFAPPGIIKEVSGLDEAAKVPGVKIVKQWLGIGDFVRAATVGYGAGILAISKDPFEALNQAKYAGNLVNFK
ncbi:ATP-grasp domain-containing protein [Sporomusa sphaeroides]|uniref:ATP-grasp domain-containing protein n=1 Tax=Sporomusa sphaeroides TaxID=47679 RepID=UPI002C5E991A|nr:ATP-grasp domain-containing protein [Sporomusa sphaeroides]HML33203.1 ATP-grasp domain-containing protein [Sporomusa sphaeroides]